MLEQNYKQSHKSTIHKKELNKKLVTDDSLDSLLKDELMKIYHRENTFFIRESILFLKYTNEKEFWLVESDEEIMSSIEE